MYPALEDGMTWDEEDLGSLAEDDPKKHHRLVFYQAIEAKYPRIVERLTDKAEDAGLEYVARALEKGRTDARTEDTNRMKNYIVEILQHVFPNEKTTGLSTKKKTGRGWEHELTGRLLTPWRLDWDNPIDRERLKSGLGGASACHGEYPNFMFRNFKANPHNMWDGFMQNELMLRATLCVFVSPTASLASDPGRTRSNRAGNAQIAGMTEMTVPALAYVAFQLRFAMSAEEMFSKGGHDSFDYSRFYYSIVNLLENEAVADLKRSLLKWYNARVFPSTIPDRSHNDETANLMIEQAKAMAAQGLSPLGDASGWEGEPRWASEK